MSIKTDILAILQAHAGELPDIKRNDLHDLGIQITGNTKDAQLLEIIRLMLNIIPVYPPLRDDLITYINSI